MESAECGVMRPLLGETLLAAWERGSVQPQPRRALTLLLAGFPGLTESDATTMSMPARDLALLRLRGCSFGDALSGFSLCPSCDEHLEFVLSETVVAETLRNSNADCTLTHSDGTVQLRLANTADVVAAAAAPGLDAARMVLLARCTQATDAAGGVTAFDALPEATQLEALAQLQAMHETAELSVLLCCPTCGGTETVPLDVPGFLWAEVRHAARLLLEEVHELAWAYGWAEPAILAMSPPRRQAYLEKLRS